MLFALTSSGNTENDIVVGKAMKNVCGRLDCEVM